MSDDLVDIELNHMLLDKKAVKCNKMREALISIAQEVLLFHDSRSIASSPNVSDNEDTFNKLIKSKSSVAHKRKIIRKLEDKVITACTVAQAAISARENVSTSLTGHLHLARNEYADLYQKHRQTSQIIHTMDKEKKLLRDALENLSNFIVLGYNELQKINSECLDVTSVTQQLKQIIVCCGQYYADFNNEREINLQLNQKNRFLNNKVYILNNSLEAISEDLKNVRHQNARLQKENNYHKERYEKLKPKYIVPIPSEFQKNYHDNYRNTMRTKVDLVRKTFDLDVTVHMSIIKKLLRDQDDLLRDLKSISKEIISEQSTM